MSTFQRSLVFVAFLITTSGNTFGQTKPKLVDPELSTTITRAVPFDYEHRELILTDFQRSLIQRTTNRDVRVGSVTLLAWKISRSTDGVPPSPEEALLLVAADDAGKPIGVAKITRSCFGLQGWVLDGFGAEAYLAVDKFPDGNTIRQFAKKTGFWPHNIDGNVVLECLVLEKRAKVLTEDAHTQNN